MLRKWFWFPQWFMNWMMFVCYESGGGSSGGGDGGGDLSGGGWDWGTIGTVTGGVGQLIGGIGGLFGGGEKQRDVLKGQKRDWYEYSKDLTRELMNYLRNEIARHKYEGFPEARNLGAVAMGGVRGMLETPPPDYMAQAQSKYGNLLETGMAGVPETEEGGYGPATYITKPEEEKTKWDKLAEENGIVVTKYRDFDNAFELGQELYKKNYSNVTVGPGEEWLGVMVLNTLFPGVCKSGVYKGETRGICYAIGHEIVRGLKALVRTGAQIGSEFIFKD